MLLLTLKAQIHATPEVEAVLKEAMRSATKVYNGLLWHLREAYKKTGKVDLSRKNLNRILKEPPRAKDYYSMSVQLTREEVREAYKAFFALARGPVVPLGMARSPRTEARKGSLARVLKGMPPDLSGRGCHRTRSRRRGSSSTPRPP
jgi:hypothetical protein